VSSASRTDKRDSSDYGPLFAWADKQSPIITAHVEVVDVGRRLANLVAVDPSIMLGLTPAQFERLICELLYEMGYEPKQVGDTYQKDGGVDIVFWPRNPVPLPVLGAAQVKHHRDARRKEGVGSVRDLAGTISGQHYGIGLLVTNTAFTPDAEWFARERAKLLRLRGYDDIERWLKRDFTSDSEWQEIPETIEVRPGLVLPIRPRLM
jgi:hypothetical protein